MLFILLLHGVFAVIGFGFIGRLGDEDSQLGRTAYGSDKLLKALQVIHLADPHMLPILLAAAVVAISLFVNVARNFT